ncbi:MarR family winged helix-turn-helix transcriptional regulator [Gordonia sp. (in: high G+C Gram-positive bacteria)]|uniref:MarR family winged helix-turn-helix transcriptional regulator n=1 Tax=Gordonia sp. (in: high G+C Gram-positive bacteria) TaxID=84139 RepID=UPI001691693C|nr:MarR family winged helix-turn-helix transcriptional regulator [Gordonia sp. (in: high G+C Gram-positive bacteria)]NLG47107.1 winged helix-turn-helix transcriptional regulator [Gordonia sp. (in: high G+C Gram-positive bacteria)]
MVNVDLPADELEIVVALQALRRRLLDGYDETDFDGLRVSQLRVIHCVAHGGVSVTELADRLAMSKQACGQFVTELVATGHLSTRVSTDDRRLKVVDRTAAGERLVKAQHQHFLEVEAGLAAEVGPARYRTFRDVLDELAFGAPPSETLNRHSTNVPLAGRSSDPHKSSAIASMT